jgi:3,4-dihydroxy 2-butanone 4-phosphate synthase
MGPSLKYVVPTMLGLRGNRHVIRCCWYVVDYLLTDIGNRVRNFFEMPARHLQLQLLKDITMNQILTRKFGDCFERVERALGALREGKGVLVADSPDRENEADLIFSAESLTVPQMALLIRECSGIVCLCMTDEKVRSLELPMMVANNTSGFQTAFTVSIEAAEGVTTGVSAADRVHTVRTAATPNATPSDLRQPGHIFPLRARQGGVLERPGHTEGTVDLMRLAGLNPCGVLCELTNPDGTMANLEETIVFAEKHGYPVLTIEDVIAYRERLELKEQVA